MKQGFTERYFQIEHARHSITYKLVQHSSLFTVYFFFPFDMENMAL